MTLPTYPSTIPYKPERGSAAISEYHRPPVVTEVEDGPTIMRVRSQTRLKKIPYVIRMTAAELDTLETFLEVTCAQATAHFTMSVPASGATYSTRRVYVEGGNWQSREVGPDLFEASFTLVVFPS